ncbi:hypothetical protein M0R45_016135 [Rubus argutus]|uniref:Uncharacterized protein n=1 Tax=Rubus argutus TaxID=59490 RepID=A0AAW1XSK7_RUBAR
MGTDRCGQEPTPVVLIWDRRRPRAACGYGNEHGLVAHGDRSWEPGQKTMALMRVRAQVHFFFLSASDFALFLPFIFCSAGADLVCRCHDGSKDGLHGDVREIDEEE